MKLTHPSSGRTVETDEARAPRYLDQGWRIVAPPDSTPEPDVDPAPETPSPAPTEKAAPRRTTTKKGQS